ncbi:hypothetical protein [Bradyrhizobium japonicum]|uniref:hypothetical protein n=1 Tax=Bradyrhizobium japonicum TaxID=375 RepID=UPI00339972F6
MIHRADEGSGGREQKSWPRSGPSSHFFRLSQGVIGTRQLKEAVFGLFFRDGFGRMAEFLGALSEALGMSAMIHALVVPNFTHWRG